MQLDKNLPESRLTWYLYGAGLENFGKDGKPEAVAMPEFGPDELLVRMDAVGICFSDIKVINQGDKHPRVESTDLTVDPVTLGHEASVTVVGVGDNLVGKYALGERYLVQPDVFYGGKSHAFGYALAGAQTQYQVIGKEILNGDEGCYLLKIKDSTGYAEAALVEPWACVVAAYLISRRTEIKPDGVMLIVDADGGNTTFKFGMDITSKTVITVGVSNSVKDELKGNNFELVEYDVDANIGEIAAKFGGFDDVIILGSNAAIVEAISEHLNKHGVLGIISNKPMDRPVKVDIGRVHYRNYAYLGTSTGVVADYYQPLRVPSQIKSGGATWMIGAGGPMGQMHLQRAVELPNGPKKILATDVDNTRLESARVKIAPIAKRLGVDLRIVNPIEMGAESFDTMVQEFTDSKGFDDVVVLAPVAPLVEQAIKHMGAECLMNIFAGFPEGTIASMDITNVFMKNIRFVGSSGSSLSDMVNTLEAAESGNLSTNTSVAAIGGIDAGWAGMKAVKEGTYPGRVVIYPQIENLPLTAVTALEDKLPNVAAKLTDGISWNIEAEAELLSTMLEGKE